MDIWIFGTYVFGIYRPCCPPPGEKILRTTLWPNRDHRSILAFLCCLQISPYRLHRSVYIQHLLLRPVAIGTTKWSWNGRQTFMFMCIRKHTFKTPHNNFQQRNKYHWHVNCLLLIKVAWNDLTFVSKLKQVISTWNWVISMVIK
jgi:hypothetical protein